MLRPYVKYDRRTIAGQHFLNQVVLLLLLLVVVVVVVTPIPVAAWSAVLRLLRLRVRIPPEAWMPVSL